MTSKYGPADIASVVAVTLTPEARALVDDTTAHCNRVRDKLGIGKNRAFYRVEGEHYTFPQVRERVPLSITDAVLRNRLQHYALTWANLCRSPSVSRKRSNGMLSQTLRRESDRERIMREERAAKRARDRAGHKPL